MRIGISGKKRRKIGSQLMIGKIPIELLPEQFSKKLGVDAKGRRKSMNAMIKTEEKEVEVEKVRRASAAQVVPSGWKINMIFL